MDVAADLKHSARVTSTKVYRSMTSNLTKSEIRALSDPEELVAAVVTKSTIALDALGEAVRDTLQGWAQLFHECAHDCVLRKASGFQSCRGYVYTPQYLYNLCT